MIHKYYFYDFFPDPFNKDSKEIIEREKSYMDIIDIQRKLIVKLEEKIKALEGNQSIH